MLSYYRRVSVVVLLFIALMVGASWAGETVVASPSSEVASSSELTAGSPQDVLAAIGSYTITREQFEHELNQFAGFSGNPQMQAHLQTKEGRKQFLNQMVEVALLEREAENRGIASRPELADEIDDYVVNMLAQQYIRSLLDTAEVTNAEVEKFYNDHKEQFTEQPKFHLHQISAADEATAKTIKKDIDGGKSFAEIAKKSSTDAFKTGGGDHGFVSLGEIAPPIAQSLLALENNQVSEPFKNDDAWMLVKYSEKQEGRLHQLADVSAQIKRELGDSKRREAYEKRLAEIAEEFKLVVASEGVAALREPEIKPADLEKTLCIIGSETIKVAAIIPDLERIPPFIRPQLFDGDGLDDFVKTFCYRELVKRYVKQHRSELEKQFPEAVSAARRHVMLETLFKEEIGGKINVSDEEAKAFYEKNLAQFAVPEQTRAHHILLESEEKAKEVLAKLEKGEKFEEIAKTESKCPSGKEGGDLGFFSKGQMVPEFDEVVNKAEIGKIVGPVKTQFGWHLIRVDERRPAGSRSFEEVKEQIKQQLLPDKQRNAYLQYVNDLKKVYPVQEFYEKL